MKKTKQKLIIFGNGDVFKMGFLTIKTVLAGTVVVGGSAYAFTGGEGTR